MKHQTIIPGINIQAPWARLLLENKKTIETRHYELPKKFIRLPLAVIETGKAEKPSRIIGIIIFDYSFAYKSMAHWKSDHKKHLVSIDDKRFGYIRGKTKFGWVVKKSLLFKKSISGPSKKGIIFAVSCHVPAKDHSAMFVE